MFRGPAHRVSALAAPTGAGDDVQGLVQQPLPGPMLPGGFDEDKEALDGIAPRLLQEAQSFTASMESSSEIDRRDDEFHAK